MKRIRLILGSLFGAGFLPFGPGTWASLLTLIPIYLITVSFPDTGLFFFLIITSMLSLITADPCVEKWGQDPPEFVMDEAAGQTIPFLFITFEGSLSQVLLLLLGGFVFFRFFDILKPLGIDRLQKLPGKFGILVDDLIAGIYALLCLHSVIFLANLFY